MEITKSTIEFIPIGKECLMCYGETKEDDGLLIPCPACLDKLHASNQILVLELGTSEKLSLVLDFKRTGEKPISYYTGRWLTTVLANVGILPTYDSRMCAVLGGIVKLNKKDFSKLYNNG